MTTIETLKLSQILALQEEAVQAGDETTVADCKLVAADYDAMFVDAAELSIAGSGIPAEQWAAADRIVKVIRNAEAQREP